MLLDVGPEHVHVLAPERLRENDRRVPRPVGVERQDLPHVVQHRLRRRMIQLVDRDHVRNLHDPRLQGLDRVAGAGLEDKHHRVRDPDHLDVGLPCTDGFHEDDVLPGGVQEEQRLEGRLGEPAEMAARPHRADEDARIEEMVGEPDAVAKQRALREGARRVDRDHAGRAPPHPHVREQCADQARLADAGRPRDADCVRAPGLAIEIANDLVGERIGALDERDRPCQRPAVTVANARGERLTGPGMPARHGYPTAETASPFASSCAGCMEMAWTSTYATTAATAAITPAPANTQRAPKVSVSGPATTIPSPSTAKFVLMITVKARPRSSSGAPRWTSSEL